MFRQYARLQAGKCASDAWVHIGTHILCTPAELKQHLEQSLSDEGAADEATLVFGELEHLYPNEATATAPLAVLYGQLGTSSFSAFHQLLRYVIRDLHVCNSVLIVSYPVLPLMPRPFATLCVTTLRPSQ